MDRFDLFLYRDKIETITIITRFQFVTSEEVEEI